MINYILLGDTAIKSYIEGNVAKCKELLKDNDASIVTWNPETQSLTNLLDTLYNWDAFLEISEEEYKKLKE